MKPPSEIKVGLVGAGYVSGYHIRALRSLPQVAIVGIADVSSERAERVRREFGLAKAWTSIDDMRGARPDVIHVLTPPSSHCALALKAFEMGAHVFVEKPMASTTAECDRMIAAADRAGRLLSVNHSAKADPIVVEALELVRRGACGKVIAVDFCRSSDYPAYAGGTVPAPFSEGGYPFRDMGVHALYLLESFLGEIRTVNIRYRSTGTDPGVYFDEWRGTAECEKGVGQFWLSWATRPVRNEIVVHGTRGYLHIDCFLQTCTFHRALPGPKAIQASVDAAAHAAGTLYMVPRNMLRFVTGRLRPSPGIHAGILQFYDALARGVAPPVSREEGRRMVFLMDEACTAADADRRRAFHVGEPLRPSRILVTGASGWLGAALLDRLRAQGKSVRALVRRPSSRLETMADVQPVYGDLGDPDAVDRAVAGVELVYHVGATMRGRGWADFQAGTVCGTSNVVHSCLRHGVKRLVHVSSMSVLDYAVHPTGAAVTEEAPLEPHADRRGFYTQSKLEAERIVLEAVRERGLPAVVVRPGQIFGPGAESIAPYGTIALAGRWIVIGSGGLRLPLVYIDDVVDGLLAAAVRDGVEGRIFHLVDPTEITQNEYIDLCRRATPHSPRVVRAPRPLVYALGAGLEVLGRALRRGVPLSRYRVRSIKELRFDCSAAERGLGWRPVVGVRAGLQATMTPRPLDEVAVG